SRPGRSREADSSSSSSPIRADSRASVCAASTASRRAESSASSYARSRRSSITSWRNSLSCIVVAAHAGEQPCRQRPCLGEQALCLLYLGGAERLPRSHRFGRTTIEFSAQFIHLVQRSLVGDSQRFKL